MRQLAGNHGCQLVRVRISRPAAASDSSSGAAGRAQSALGGSRESLHTRAISEVISRTSRTPLPEPRATPVVRDLGLLRTPSAHPRPLDGVDHVPRTHLGARQRAGRGGEPPSC